MITPVWLDGSLKGQVHEVSEQAVQEGSYPVTPQEVYTFTRVQLLGRVVVVASVRGGIPQMDLLFDRLTSPAAQAAAELHAP
jgi:hypothetical protein